MQRIYEGDGPIASLCYESPQTLYFLRRSAGSSGNWGTSDVWKLDLNTNTETLVAQIPTSGSPYGGTAWALDLAEVGDAFEQAPWWWIVPSALWKSFIAAARYVVRIAEALHKPAPHPDPRELKTPSKPL